MEIVKIFGGPGAGKTTRLVEIIKKEVLDGTPVNRIAFISHTTAATTEAWDRVHKVMKVKYKPKFFCTIHSAAMNRSGIGRQEVFQDWPELSKRSRLKFTGQGMSVLDGRESDNLTSGDPILVLKNFASSNKISLEEARQQLPRYDVLTPANIERTLRIFDDLKKETGKLDFDDMLNFYVDNEADPLPVDIVLVDEAQDLSKLQWDVVHKLARGAKRMYIVGDDDQAIYSFIGADPYGFLDHDADQTIILDKSWRVPQEIGTLADRIIRKVQKRQDKPFEWRQDKQGRIQYVNSDPYLILRKAEVPTMLLARHKMQCWGLHRELDEHHIPHSINGESLLNNARSHKLRAFLELRRGDEISISRAADAVSLVPHQTERLKKMRDAARQNPEMTVTKSKINLDWDQTWWEYAAKTAQEERNNFKIRKSLNRHGLEILGVDPKIDISTIHASKGRESDHVVIMTDCYKSVTEEQIRTMENELRLAYVGVTRAKEKLTIVRPQTVNVLKALI